MWFAGILMVLFWLLYWRLIYTETVEHKVAKVTQNRDAEVAARLFGHLSNLISALLLLPVSRTGIWVDVFAIPYDRAIKYKLMGRESESVYMNMIIYAIMPYSPQCVGYTVYPVRHMYLPPPPPHTHIYTLTLTHNSSSRYHRILGSLGFLFVTIHAMLWWNIWANEDLLGHNIVAFNDLTLSPGRIAYQDFSILLEEIAWFLMAVSLGMAVFMRRRLYFIFQYTHKFIGVIYYITAITHAWSFW